LVVVSGGGGLARFIVGAEKMVQVIRSLQSGGVDEVMHALSLKKLFESTVVDMF
jgi:uridylate kinase